MIKPAVIGSTLAVLFLAGCAGSPDWKNPGTTSAQQHQALADCRVVANQADSEEAFDDCMIGKGFVKD